jgi:hypothetical protein
VAVDQHPVEGDVEEQAAEDPVEWRPRAVQRLVVVFHRQESEARQQRPRDDDEVGLCCCGDLRRLAEEREVAG